MRLKRSQLACLFTQLVSEKNSVSNLTSLTQILSMVIYTSKDKPEHIGGEGFHSRMDTHSSSLSLPLDEAAEAQ